MPTQPSKHADTGQSCDAEDNEDERGSITHAARQLGLLTLLSRFTGLGRDIVIGALFGASPSADAFFVAFRIPNLFRRVVAEGAASTAFVPVFTRHLVVEGKDAALRAAGAVGGIAVLILAVLTVAGIVYSGGIVALFAPGFQTDPSKYALTASLTAWTFPYLLLVGVAAWAMATLHTFRRFAAPALGPIFLNLSIISATLLLAPRLQQPVYALVVGVLLGGLCQVLVQVPSLSRVGMRLPVAIVPRHPAVTRVGRLLLPTLVGGGVYQVNILVATLLASMLPAGSVSWLWYADRVLEFPLGIVAVAVGTAALPSLSDQAKRARLNEMGESLSWALRLTWVFCIPATLGIWILSQPIVAVLFQRGSFTEMDTIMAAWALRAAAVGLLGVASARVLVAAFYALEKPGKPVLAAVVAFLVNVIVDLALMGSTDPAAPSWAARPVASVAEMIRLTDMRHAGLALGAATAAIVNAGLLACFLRRELPLPPARPTVRSLGIHGGSALVMAVVLILWHGVVARLAGGEHAARYLEALGGTIVGALVYVGVALALGSSELRHLFTGKTRSVTGRGDL